MKLKQLYLISKLRKLSLGSTKPRQPNPFKNKPTGKTDPNFDPDPTGMASGGLANILRT